jgi:hypothetical protein
MLDELKIKLCSEHRLKAHRKLMYSDVLFVCNCTIMFGIFNNTVVLYDPFNPCNTYYIIITAAALKVTRLPIGALM